MQILKLRAARRWSVSQTARAFHITEQTIISWMQRLDEAVENALIQLAEPVNKFNGFVRSTVRQLKTFFLGLGKEKIAQFLARAGLHLGVTTVGRMIKKKPFKNVEEEIPGPEDVDTEKIRIVAVIDHFSRWVIGFAVYKKKPTSIEVRSFLVRAFQKSGKTPRHMIMDKDSIFFFDDFKKWCKRRQIRPRYGAVGKYGSVSVIERFIKSMKNEGTKKILVPLRLEAMRRELSYYVSWYIQFRPHSFLKGKTPQEVYKDLVPADAKSRFEPRSRWPRGSPCASPQTMIKGKQGSKPLLVIGFFEGRNHLSALNELFYNGHARLSGGPCYKYEWLSNGLLLSTIRRTSLLYPERFCVIRFAYSQLAFR
jgi:hypothetical protein